MDEQAKIDTYKQGLRVFYAGNVNGLRNLAKTLFNGEASESVVVTGQGFEGEQSNAQLVLEPMAKLKAALEVLDEMDPDNAPEVPASTRFADFSLGGLEI